MSPLATPFSFLLLHLPVRSTDLISRWHLSENTHHGRAEEHRDNAESALRDGLSAHSGVLSGGGGRAVGLGAGGGSAGGRGLGGGSGISLIGVAEDAAVSAVLAGQAVAQLL